MSAKLLLTGPHVDRALTLLALIRCAANPAPRADYEERLARLRRYHPELIEITDEDPRIGRFIADVREAFEAQPGVSI